MKMPIIKDISQAIWGFLWCIISKGNIKQSSNIEYAKVQPL